MTSGTASSRIQLVDALRGFAILAILLLHNIEHFDFYYMPGNLPKWMLVSDKWIWDSLFFLFAGKAYGIFALLFGFTFYLQLNSAQNKAGNFKLRFLWRLFILLLFGIINSMFYEGDILTFYAILGVALLPVSSLSNKTVLIIAIFLLLQPLELAKAIFYFAHPDYIAQPNPSNAYFEKTGVYLAGDSFFELVKGNLINGRLAVLHWTWENGRIFQTPAYFMIGMLLGRQGRFYTSSPNKKFWFRVFIVTVLLCIPLFFIKDNIGQWISETALSSTLSMVIRTWWNFAFMIVLVSGFVILYFKGALQKIVPTLATFGRMSLTNYIMQSILGTFIYYGYGLGMYQYTGATYCLLIGLILFFFQYYFCRWWLSKHKQGPLEGIWRRASIGRDVGSPAPKVEVYKKPSEALKL